MTRRQHMATLMLSYGILSAVARRRYDEYEARLAEFARAKVKAEAALKLKLP